MTWAEDPSPGAASRQKAPSVGRSLRLWVSASPLKGGIEGGSPLRFGSYRTLFSALPHRFSDSH